MSNSLLFHEAWKTHRAKVRGLRETYEKSLRGLEPYQGSKGYDEDVAKAEKAFSDGLDELRADSKVKFGRILSDLEKHVEPETMTAPTAEQLQLLQMLDLRDSLDANELEQAAKALGGNDAAIKTLGDIARRKGHILPAAVKTKAGQRRHALDELKQAVSGLMEWDGRDRARVMRDWGQARNNFKYGDGSKVPENALSSLHVADVEAGAGAADTLQAIVPEVDYGTLSAFMNE